MYLKQKNVSRWSDVTCFPSAKWKSGTTPSSADRDFTKLNSGKVILE
jgi:hypothetical protein